jgi:nitrogen regulatory protein P-II 1
VKLITCIIRPEKLGDVVEELSKIVSGLTISEVRGHGRQAGHSTVYRGVEYEVTLRPKIMIEIVTDDNKVEDVVDVLNKTARTGEVGDGRIFVSPVDEAYHVRTGFMDRRYSKLKEKMHEQADPDTGDRNPQ